jgi:hypothetical protein
VLPSRRALDDAEHSSMGYENDISFAARTAIQLFMNDLFDGMALFG